MDFGRLLTAMVTPFDEEENMDLKAVETLVEHLIASGTEGIVVAGTTGESPTLTGEEKRALFEKVVRVVDGRVPVIAGTGSNNTRASIALTREAEQIGVDGIMLVAPYYNKPCQEGLYRHFRAIAEATSLPVMLYNIPGRSVVNVSVDTVVRLADVDNIVAIKEASGDLDAMAAIIERTPQDFVLYSGDDAMTIPAMSVGGHGVVSVASHVLGNDMQEMISRFVSGDIEGASELHRRLLPMMRALFQAPSPAPVKAALEMTGIPVGGVRLPLVPLNDQQREQLRRVFQWKLPDDVKEAVVS